MTEHRRSKDVDRQPTLSRKRRYVRPTVELRQIAAVVAGDVGSLQDPGGGRNPTRSG